MRSLITSIITFVSLLVGGLFFLAPPIDAQACPVPAVCTGSVTNPVCPGGGTQIGYCEGGTQICCLPPGTADDKFYEETGINCAVVNAIDNPLKYPICAFKELGTLTTFVLTWIIVATGVGSLGVFLWGGFLYITAGEVPSKAMRGRQAITWGVIGGLAAASIFILLRLLSQFTQIPVFTLVPSAYAQESADFVEELVQISGEITSNETRKIVPGSKVTLYWFSPDGWVLWPAQQYNNQRNPYTADVFGRYQFLVPPGSYYVVVDRNGFFQEQTQVIEVSENMPVVKNIALREGRIIWSYLVLAGWIVFILAVTYIIVRSVLIYRKRKILRSHLLQEIQRDVAVSPSSESKDDKS